MAIIWSINQVGQPEYSKSEQATLTTVAHTQT